MFSALVILRADVVFTLRTPIRDLCGDRLSLVALRLLASNDPAAGLSLLNFGIPDSGQAILRNGADMITIDLPALRNGRDRIRRYGDMLGKVRETQGKVRLTREIGLTNAFSIIFSADAFPIAAVFRRCRSR